METRSKRKLNQFKRLTPKKSRSSSNLITNQATLVGLFLKLMENQKAIIAVVRVPVSSNDEKMLPICFKVTKDQIPVDIHECQIHAKNLITLQVPGCNSISAMIVSTGDDSQQLFENYSIFVNNAKQQEVNNIETKINDWLDMDNVSISKLKSKGLPITSKLDFDKIIEKSKKPKQLGFPPLNEPKEANFPSIELLDLSTDSSEKGKNVKECPASSASQWSEINSGLRKLRSLTRHSMDSMDMKAAFRCILNILESIVYTKEFDELMTRPDLLHDSGFDSSGNRLVPEKDKTCQIGTTTMIEGILPLPTEKYKQALASGHGTGVEPTTILTNIVRFAFPDHWLVGVTLRGTGGKTGLSTVWNYINPLLNPCSGGSRNGLGEKRIRCLFDHVMRKAGKLSYDRGNENALVTSISKAMHNNRIKIAPAKVTRQLAFQAEPQVKVSESVITPTTEPLSLTNMKLFASPEKNQPSISEIESTAKPDNLQQEIKVGKSFTLSDFGGDSNEEEEIFQEKEEKDNESDHEEIQSSPPDYAVLDPKDRLPDAFNAINDPDDLSVPPTCTTTIEEIVESNEDDSLSTESFRKEDKHEEEVVSRGDIEECSSNSDKRKTGTDSDKETTLASNGSFYENVPNTQSRSSTPLQSLQSKISSLLLTPNKSTPRSYDSGFSSTSFKGVLSPLSSRVSKRPAEEIQGGETKKSRVTSTAADRVDQSCDSNSSSNFNRLICSTENKAKEIIPSSSNQSNVQAKNIEAVSALLSSIDPAILAAFLAAQQASANKN